MNAEETSKRTSADETDVVLRPWRDESDLPAIAAVLNASVAADGIDIYRSVDEVRNFLEHTPHLDPEKDTFLAEADGRLVAYGDASWSDEIAGGRVYRVDMYVLPDYRATTLPARLFTNVIDRLKAIAATHPVVHPKFLHIVLGESEGRLRTVVEARGFKPTRTFYRMLRADLKDIPDLPLPPGLEIRRVDPTHFRPIYTAMREAFQDHWGTRPASEEDYQRWVNDPVADPDLWQVAWDGDQVAGMVLNVIDEEENRRYDRARGYTEDICVRRPWRRRGLARALIAHSLRVVREAGMTEAALGVDSDNQNGALGLYHDLGYETQWKFFAYRKPLTQEVG